MAQFEKSTAKTSQDVPTSAMPDVVFMLLIFFMVTTVLRKVTLKVDVDFTHAKNIKKITQKRLISYIYVGPMKGSTGGGENNIGIQIDDKLMRKKSAIRQIMEDKLAEQPKLIVSLRVDDKTPSGIVTDIQQQLRQAGTLKVNYSTKPKKKK